MRWVLGVTGAIGAGKSTVCRILRHHGWSVLDIDDVAAESLEAARPWLGRRLPAALAGEGGVNKGLVFAAMLREPAFLQELEAALQPFVWQRVRRWRDELSGPGALDAALLFESGLDALCDATLCLRCSQDERRRRVAARPTASALHFDALDAAQWPESEKRARAGLTLVSEGGSAELEQKLRVALQTLGRAL